MSFMRPQGSLSAGKIGAALIIFAVLVLAGIFIYQAVINQNRGLEVELETEKEIFVGEPFEIGVILTNHSPNVLKNVGLALNLPAGAVFADRRGTMRKTIEVGNLDIGETYKDGFEVIVLYAAREKKNFNLEITYLPASLNKNLVMTKDIQVNVLPGIDLEVRAPEKVMIGEQFEWLLSYKNVSLRDRELEMEIIAPPELSTDFREHTVLIRSGEQQQATFKGQIVLPEGSSFELGVRLKERLAEQEYVLNEKTVEITIAPAPLSFKVLVNDRENMVAAPGDLLRYDLIFQNNAATTLKDLTVRTALKGEMYDFRTLSTDGLFNSASRTIVWNPAALPMLKSIAPGESKQVSFTLAVKSEYPIRRINDKNFVLEAQSQIESPTVPYLVGATKTVNVVNIVTKVRGDLRVESKALFRDAASHILNQGPWPPEVGQATEFTVHWLVYNYATDVSGVEVRARLEPNVVFTGKANAAVGEIYFDEQKQEVVWQIAKILATSGIINEPLSAVFQIRATPKSEHRGGFMPLLGETTISGQDEFTQAKLNYSFKSLTTALEGDPTINPGEGVVR